jgi:CDGSH iron-sulfur domain-containing protein 3
MPEPRVAGTRPVVLDLEPGHYSFCTCGYSENQPFCDGKHIGKGFVPSTLSVDTPQKVAFCLCKHSAKGHQCDGSHRQLPPCIKPILI